MINEVDLSKDLISKSKLYDEAVRLSGPFTGDGWDNWGVYNLIMRQPAVDAVPVVRCEECALRHTLKCPRLIDFGHILEDRTWNKGFCDKGTRKDDANA